MGVETRIGGAGHRNGVPARHSESGETDRPSCLQCPAAPDVFVGPKPVGFSCRNSRLVVESLGGAGCELSTGSKRVEQLWFMLT